MAIVLICAGCALVGYLLGLIMADRIAEHKIAEMRAQMGLDVDTGEEIDSKDKVFDELFKE